MVASSQFKDEFPAIRLFNQGYSYTYNDVIFLPHYIDFLTDLVQLATKLTPNIHLSTTCVASPMDTVIESSMAALGAIDIIHSNNSISNQAFLVQSAKSHRIPFLSDLIFKSPSDSVHSTHEFASSSSIFVTESGAQKSKFVGVVTRSDWEKSVENKEARASDYIIRSTVHVQSSYHFEDVAGYLAAKIICTISEF